MEQQWKQRWKAAPDTATAVAPNLLSGHVKERRGFAVPRALH